MFLKFVVHKLGWHTWRTLESVQSRPGCRRSFFHLSNQWVRRRNGRARSCRSILLFYPCKSLGFITFETHFHCSVINVVWFARFVFNLSIFFSFRSGQAHRCGVNGWVFCIPMKSNTYLGSRSTSRCSIVNVNAI